MSESRRVLTPSEVNREIRGVLENSYRSVWVRGEVSNLFRSGPGHLYFSLKDSGAQLKCALFRRRNAAPAALDNGTEVVVHGRLSLYEPRGDFQLIADSVELAGEGALRQQFDALKAKLQAEGLFERATKRALPAYPHHVAVVTSPSGAAIRDVISVMERRWPVLRLTVVPSLVQGDAAPAALRRALTQAIALSPDAILLTRGGGSLEDLWAFNDEDLARQVAASPIPTVAAVGHETDFSIVEFVADQRAPTPSAAAELITPDGGGLSVQLTRTRQSLGRAIDSLLARQSLRLVHLERRLAQRHPQQLLRDISQRRSLALQRLSRLGRGQLAAALARHRNMEGRLAACGPSRRLALAGQRLAQLQPRMRRALRQTLEARRSRLSAVKRTLQALNPRAVLERGFAIVSDERGLVVRSASQVTAGQGLVAEVSDGRIRVTVEE